MTAEPTATRAETDAPPGRSEIGADNLPVRSPPQPTADDATRFVIDAPERPAAGHELTRLRWRTLPCRRSALFRRCWFSDRGWFAPQNGNPRGWIRCNQICFCSANHEHLCRVSRTNRSTTNNNAK